MYQDLCEDYIEYNCLILINNVNNTCNIYINSTLGIMTMCSHNKRHHDKKKKSLSEMV